MSRFELFRYQILPVDRYFQTDMFDGFDSVEELLKKKNQYFAEALRQTDDFSSSRTKTVTKKLIERDDFFLFRVAAHRSVNRETENFESERLENWPSVLVAVWNDPTVQLIAVQKRSSAFPRAASAVNLVVEKISSVLDHQQLRVISDPLFEKRVFWDLVKKYKGKIQRLEFEFITPNMANISGSLPKDLKDFAKSVNSHRNSLSIESDNQSALNVSEDNNTMAGLVEYSSEGGGNVSLKISGLSKKHHTSKTVKEIEVSEIELNGTGEEVI